MQLQHGFLDVNGSRLFYEVAGAGVPLVLIHGTALDTRMWDDQVAVLAQHYQVVRYDRRGFGRSALPTATYSHADDLAALLAALELHHPVLLGHSSGGGVALDFARAQPTAVRALILYESVLRGYSFAPAFSAYLGAVRTLARQGDLVAARERWLEPLAAQLGDAPEAVEQLQQMAQTYSGWHWLNDDGERAASGSAELPFDRLGMPTLIVVGERTVADMQRIAAILEREIPQARRVEVAQGGHLANMQFPAAFNQAILAFLAACGV